MQKYDNTERQSEVGDWLIVHYTEKYSEDDYPGEVTMVDENEVTVSVKHKYGCFFKQPNHEGEINYRMESISAKIDPPTVAGN